MIDLLDASREVHPAALVELLVHGHTHGRKVATHAHAAPGSRDAGPRLDAPVELGTLPAKAGASGLAASPAPRPPGPGAADSSLPPKFLLHAALRR